MTRELLKWLGEDGMEEFRMLLNKIWEIQEVPEEWTKGILHPLEKVKGKVGLDNIRPITLLKVLSVQGDFVRPANSVLLATIKDHKRQREKESPYIH